MGRDAERAEFRRLMEQARAGAGALVMVGGEPGVGKSRLADELRQRCEADGFATFVGHCYEAAGAPPYVPVVEAFEQALAAAPERRGVSPVPWRRSSEVARLVPKLRRLCPDIPPPLELPAEQERRYLFNSVVRGPRPNRLGRPTLLVLDDIHWADEPTMLLVAHIAERIAEIPVLMVGLYRDNELDAGRPLSQHVRGADPPAPRPAHASRTAARRRGGADAHRPRRPGAATRAGRSLLRPDRREPVLHRGGVPPPGRGRPPLRRRWMLPHRTEGSDELDVPEGVRMVVAARLRRLGDDGARVLGSAAVLGRVFSFELLQSAGGTPREHSCWTSSTRRSGPG